jgi:hypothetical protein
MISVFSVCIKIVVKIMEQRPLLGITLKLNIKYSEIGAF